MAVADDTQRQLEWERRQRPRAGIAALLGALLVIGVDVWTNTIFRDAPRAGFLTALGRAVEPGPAARAESVRTASLQFYADHGAALQVGGVLKALGFLAFGWALFVLALATRARREETGRPVPYLPLVGGVLLAVSSVLASVGFQRAAANYLAGPHTAERSADATTDTLFVTAQFIGLVGLVAMALGFVFVSLNAMRAGLLTRFMGILGILAGALLVLSLGQPLAAISFLQALWLIGLGALFLGVRPASVPPAWRSGRAEPWPSQADMARQRREAAAPASPAPPPEQPGGQRRKRKRRS